MTTKDRIDTINNLHEQALRAIEECDLFRQDADEAYKKGLDEAWEAARKICDDEEYGGIPMCDVNALFGEDIEKTVMARYTASQALAKLRDYEARKKAEDEAVKVGDEVITDGGTRFVVTFVWDEGRLCAGYDSEGRHCGTGAVQCRKTGRHFPGIAAVLDQMKGE